MTSILAQAAHNVAASLLGHPHIQPGATIPAADVKEDSPDKATPLTLTGKNILVSFIMHGDKAWHGARWVFECLKCQLDRSRSNLITLLIYYRSEFLAHSLRRAIRISQPTSKSLTSSRRRASMRSMSLGLTTRL